MGVPEMGVPDGFGLHIAGVNYESMVDGEGMRTTIFLSGCPHHCKGCQNPETWDPNYGVPASGAKIQEIAHEIVSRWDFLNGITLSGGDPFYNPLWTWMLILALDEAVLFELGAQGKGAQRLPGGLWIYTGYTFEALRKKKDYFMVKELYKMATVIVDGPFVEELRDVSLPYRGSSNQRLIDAKRSSLDTGVVVEWQPQSGTETKDGYNI